MKTTIRTGLFETNSSSMHSITIMKQGGGYDRPSRGVYIDNGELRIWDDGEICHERAPFRILCSMFEKAEYYIASIIAPLQDACQFDEVERMLDELNAILHKYCPEFDHFRFPSKEVPAYVDADGNAYPYTACHYVLDEEHPYGAYYVEMDGKRIPVTRDDYESCDIEDMGYVDHQSAALLKRFFEHTGVSLEDFLTDRKYLVIIDGDERCDWKKYKNAGIVNTDGIDKEFPYDFDIDNNMEED